MITDDIFDAPEDGSPCGYDVRSYDAGYEAAIRDIRGVFGRAYQDGHSDGYGQGFKDGYDLGHDIATGAFEHSPPDTYNTCPDNDTRCPTDLAALSAEDLRFYDDVDHDYVKVGPSGYVDPPKPYIEDVDGTAWFWFDREARD